MTQTLTFTKKSLLLRHITVALIILRFLRILMRILNHSKNFIRHSDTWVDNISFSKNSNFQLSDYQVLHQTRKNRKGEGVCVFVHENLSFKLTEDLSINCDGIQSLSIEISVTKSKNIILNTIYRPPNSDMKQCETHFKDVFSKNGKNLKNIVLAGDFNI